METTDKLELRQNSDRKTMTEKAQKKKTNKKNDPDFCYVCSEYDKQIAQLILWVVLVVTEPLIHFTRVLMLDSHSAFASAQLSSNS